MVNKCELLKGSEKIAVIGISRQANRISRVIAEYLRNNGYDVVGVNPNSSFNDADGIKVFNSLLDIPHKIDIVNIFRKSDDIPELVDDIIKIRPNAVWLQLGIRNDDAVKPIEDQGILVVQDTCIKVEHSNCF